MLGRTLPGSSQSHFGISPTSYKFKSILGLYSEYVNERLLWNFTVIRKNFPMNTLEIMYIATCFKDLVFIYLSFWKHALCILRNYKVIFNSASFYELFYIIEVFMGFVIPWKGQLVPIISPKLFFMPLRIEISIKKRVTLSKNLLYLCHLLWIKIPEMRHISSRSWKDLKIMIYDRWTLGHLLKTPKHLIQSKMKKPKITVWLFVKLNSCRYICPVLHLSNFLFILIYFLLLQNILLFCFLFIHFFIFLSVIFFVFAFILFFLCFS